jgi:hypothetical protein
MSTIGQTYDPTKQKEFWYSPGKDKATKALDKVEDKVTGDAYDYANKTKAGIEAEKLDRNVQEFAKTVTFSVLPKLGGNAIKDAALVSKIILKVEDVSKKARAGKLTQAEAAAEIATFLASEGLSKVAELPAASIAMMMLKATTKAVDFAIEDQKLEEQLYHDEAARLHIAECAREMIPVETYQGVSEHMSTFGQTHLKTETFAAVQAAFEQTGASAEVKKHVWQGKAAALDLEIKDKAALAKVLDPNNKSPKAIAFREMYNEKSNVAFRLGVSAMIDEQSGTSAKTKALYAADVERFNKERAAFDAKAAPIKP